MGWWGYVLGAATMAVATLVAGGLSRGLSGPNLMLYVFGVYISATALVATRLDPKPSVLAAVLGALSFDVFFVPAVYSRSTSATHHLVAFGVMLILAILISKSAARIRARQQELEVLNALDGALAEANHPEDVARIAAERSVPLLGLDAAAMLLFDSQDKTLRLRRRLHAPAVPSAVAAILEQGIPVGPALIGQAVAERRPVVVDVARDPTLADVALAAAARAAGYTTVATTPLVAHGRVYGALSLLSRRRFQGTPAVTSLLASVGTQIAIALAHVAERERLAAQERMAALGRLAAGVAHELNNPLAVIAHHVVLLEGDATEAAPPLADRLAQYATNIDEAVERTKRIMSGLSIYSKPPRPEPQILNVGDLLNATRELVGFSAKNCAVKVSVDVSPGLPPVLGDRSGMMQVLLNLANNAIEAMAESGGELALRAWTERGVWAKADVPMVKVAVADTGPGIEPQNLARIWSAFYTSKAEGTGLGLSIVRGIVAETPGATIELTSEPGKGATFTLTVPAASTQRA